MQATYYSRRHDADRPAQLQDPSAPLYLLGGVLLGTCFSTAFWVLALMFASSAAGFTLATPVLVVFALAVAAICWIVLAAVVVDRR